MVQTSNPLKKILADPIRAAIFAALVTLFAKWVDNRMLKKQDVITEYLKLMAFNAGLVAFIIYSVFKQKGTGTGTGYAAAAARLPGLGFLGR